MKKIVVCPKRTASVDFAMWLIVFDSDILNFLKDVKKATEDTITIGHEYLYKM